MKFGRQWVPDRRAATEKARRPNVIRRHRGTVSWCWLAHRRSDSVWLVVVCESGMVGAVAGQVLTTSSDTRVTAETAARGLSRFFAFYYFCLFLVLVLGTVIKMSFYLCIQPVCRPQRIWQLVWKFQGIDHQKSWNCEGTYCLRKTVYCLLCILGQHHPVCTIILVAFILDCVFLLHRFIVLLYCCVSFLYY